MTPTARSILALLAADPGGRALLRHLLAAVTVALGVAGLIVATTTGGTC